MTMRMNRRDALLHGGALALLASSHVARAQQLPPDTLRIVSPFAAGVGSDNHARALAEAYRQVTGRNCVVDSRPGGNTTIGSAEVARAKPDGQTILWTTGGHTTNAVLAKKLPYDSIRDFTPVSQITRSPGFVLLVGGNSPYKTLRELVDDARAHPGKLTYGSTGIGNTTHVAGALFCRAAGIDMLHVPYRTSPMVDTISGRVDMMFMGPTLVMSQLRSGQLRALGLSGDQRARLLPDVPTYAEAGFPQPDLPSCGCVLAPAGLPSEVLASLYSDIAKAAHHPVFTKYIDDTGSSVVATDPATFRRYIVSEIGRFERILPPLGIEMK